jgi:thioester reductase-like protein
MTGGAGDVLLTGTTGFVGMELLARYLERSDRRVVALVRAGSSATPQSRIDDVLDNLFGSGAGAYRDRVDVIAADLTAPGLGIERSVREALAERVTTIVHGAASVSFTLPIGEAREINVAGTRRMLDFAQLALECGGLDCYGHISTAFVAGDHVGGFAESDLDVGQSFHNSYEQSKFEAEQLVRARPELPCTIMRPSIVVGDRISGWTAAFNVLYWPLRAFARGLFTAVPAIPTAPVDVVSIDYVADAIYDLVQSRCGSHSHSTYHLTAGPHASTMAEIASLASRYFRRPAPRVMSPAEFAVHRPECGAAEESALRAGQAYFPYFAFKAVFETTVTRARLDPEGIHVSPLGDYLERLLDFATRSRWGKRPIARADAFV